METHKPGTALANNTFYFLILEVTEYTISRKFGAIARGSSEPKRSLIRDIF